jgi:hypothetical protein
LLNGSGINHEREEGRLGKFLSQKWLNKISMEMCKTLIEVSRLSISVATRHNQQTNNLLLDRNPLKSRVGQCNLISPGAIPFKDATDKFP